MKIFCYLLLSAGFLRAAEIEGTIWYDSKGEIAVVDGPAAEKRAPASFIPQWVAREARRDQALRGGYRRSRSGQVETSYPWGWGSSTACFRPYPRFPVSCIRPSRGVRIIIR